MPLWLHRTTKQLLPSVASADLPEPQEQYIEYPDLSAVEGFAKKYWLVQGNSIVLMTVPQRASVDLADREAQKDAIVNELDDSDNLLSALALVLLDEINILRKVQALPPLTFPELRTAFRSKL